MVVVVVVVVLMVIEIQARSGARERGYGGAGDDVYCSDSNALRKISGTSIETYQGVVHNCS